MRKKLLALLLAAALALSLLAGCGGGESVASALLKLLDGRYPNISIEIDPELEADLRQAIRKAEAENAGDDDAVIRAALEKLVGSTVTFRKLGEGQQGDTTFDLVFYSGTDPGKAAQAAYSQWNIVFDNVPDDGQYDTSLAMVETENGVWMLVKATVEKAGTVDKPEADPVILKSIAVTGPSKTEYKVNDSFEPDGMVVTAYYSDGSNKPIAAGEYTIVIDDKEVSSPYQFDRVGPHTLKVKYNEMVSTNSVSIWVADKDGYHEDGNTYIVTGIDGLQNLFKDHETEAASADITLETDQTLTGTEPLADTFTGTLNGNGNKITMTGTRTQGLFNEIGASGKVLNVDIEVSGTINGSDFIGAVAGWNLYGTIKGCSVTGGSISGTDDSSLVGGVVGINDGSVTACYSTGAVSGTGTGGVAGYNVSGSVTACYHAVGEVSGGIAGGVVGYNDGTVNDCYWSGSPEKGIGGGNTSGTTKVTADGDDDPNADPVNWDTALAGLNGQNTGYTFGGDMDEPTLTKKP